ncbi:MAG: hypothetical protein PHZ09_10615 [Eubacteriales bacterium]|nr:hypothetical protein [Eubacteriales bacterium]
MNREKLISQVKEHYAKLASKESQQHFDQSTVQKTPVAYYEFLLGSVIDEINAGTFDSFDSGQEIVNAVANDKSRWLST